MDGLLGKGTNLKHSSNSNVTPPHSVFAPSLAQEHPLGEWNGLPGARTLGLCWG